MEALARYKGMRLSTGHSPSVLVPQKSTGQAGDDEQASKDTKGRVEDGGKSYGCGGGRRRRR